jgi:hypothetical protein
MVGESKREGLMGLMGGPGLGIGSFDKIASFASGKFRREVEKRLADEIFSLIEKSAETIPPDQRSAFMQAVVLRTLSDASSEGERLKGIDQLPSDRVAEQLVLWLRESATRSRFTNANSLDPAEISLRQPARMAFEQVGDIASAVSASAQRTVALDSVIRGGSYFTAAISMMSIVATAMSNVIIIQPFIALFFLIASIGFFCMTLVPHARTPRDS